jgi:hypothetical protein
MLQTDTIQITSLELNTFLTLLHLKMTALWDTAPCKLVEADSRFRDA